MFSIPRVPDKQRPMLRFLIVLSVASIAGLQVWRTLINNFAVEWANLDGSHIGVVQSVREIPGFLALLAIYVMLIIKEHRLSAFSILLLGIGLGVTGVLPTFTGLMIATLISSFGFHYYETTNMSSHCSISIPSKRLGFSEGSTALPQRPTSVSDFLFT